MTRSHRLLLVAVVLALALTVLAAPAFAANPAPADPPAQAPDKAAFGLHKAHCLVHGLPAHMVVPYDCPMDHSLCMAMQ